MPKAEMHGSDIATCSYKGFQFQGRLHSEDLIPRASRAPVGPLLLRIRPSHSEPSPNGGSRCWRAQVWVHQRVLQHVEHFALGPLASSYVRVSQ